MPSSKLEFLEKSMLGRNTNFNDFESVMKSCISKSYGDMMQGGMRYKLVCNKTNVVNETYELIKKHNYKFSRQLIVEEESILSASPIIKSKKKGWTDGTSFGMAQKIVNMAYKHFFVFDKYINKNINYKDCDCPLDSNVLAKLGVDDKYKWTRITLKDYIDIQLMIKKEMKTNKEIVAYINKRSDMNELGNLAYDFLAW